MSRFQANCFLHNIEKAKVFSFFYQIYLGTRKVKLFLHIINNSLYTD